MNNSGYSKLYWLEETTLNGFIKMCRGNESGYKASGFDDFFSANQHALRDIGVTIDHAELKKLEGISSTEINDACTVFGAISGMTPSIACHGNIWAHLSHTHLLDFGRSRWIKPDTPMNTIEKHFNEYSSSHLRDDHASSRPWWTAYIASRIAKSEKEGDIKEVLKYTARSTDTRQATVERSLTFSDVPLASGLVNLIKTSPQLHSKNSEEAIRKLMKEANFKSNGKSFDDFSLPEIKNVFQ